MDIDWKQRAQTAEHVCSETYQAVGHLASLANAFEHEAVTKLMDNLVAAAEGESPPHKDILPFYIRPET